jgi:type IV pilus assembly protein PilX
MKRSRGAVLVISLVLLLALSLIGVSAMQSATQEEHISGNARQHNLAFQAAEAGLRAGETYLAGMAVGVNNWTTAGLQKTALTIASDIATFWLNPNGTTDGTSYNWTGAAGTNSGSVPVTLESTPTTLNAQPRYVIEYLATATAAGGGALEAGVAGGLPGSSVYRVTARGTGGTSDAVAILQSIYRH